MKSRIYHVIDNEGIRFEMEHDPQPQWWRSLDVAWNDSDLPLVLLLRSLEDDDVGHSAGEHYRLSHAHWLSLSRREQRQLKVAEPWPYPLKLKAKGAVGHKELRLEIESYESRQRSERKKVWEWFHGPFVRHDGQIYFLPAEILNLQREIDQNSAQLSGMTSENLLAVGRVLGAAAQCDIELDRHLSQQAIFAPEKIGLEAACSQDGALEIFPALPHIGVEPKLQKQLDSQSQVSTLYQYQQEDGRSARVVLSPEAKEAIEEVRTVRRLSGDKLKKFLDSPEQFLKSSNIDLSDFGDRVVGLVTKRVRFYPQLPKSETEWFPTVTLRVEDQAGLQSPWDMVVDHTQVGEMLQSLAQAQAASVSTFDYQGYEFPANPVVQQKLEGLLQKLTPPKDDVPPDPKPERLELEILENVDSVEYYRSAEDADFTDRYHRPPTLKRTVELLPHQQRGVGWLQGLYSSSKRSGALLADDMGLGKTIQLWSFLEWARFEQEHRGVQKPSLIICPLSLIETWLDEYQKFFDGPEALRRPYFVILRGADGKRFFQDGILDVVSLSRYPYVLATYETVRQHHLQLPRVDWHCVVLDEAQKIKFPNTQVTRSCKALKADFRIASTGTPVENSLADLWCIVDFLEPGRLGALKDFLKEFTPDGAEVEDLTSKIKARLGKVLMRRLKHQIDTGLPAKRIVAETVTMSPRQQEQYRAITAKAQGESTLTVLQTLRRLCAFQQDPELVQNPEELRELASKFDWLIQCLDRIQKQQEKVIIFLEIREFQRILVHWLSLRYGQQVRTINGEVSADREAQGSRHQILQEFNDSPGFRILILSPLAAGVGLTITCANHVIHYMRHWNPAKEDQATDRAYRIGQSKEVFVYYPISTHPDFRTFDQGLHDLLDRKRELAKRALFPTLYGEIKPGNLLEECLGTSQSSGPEWWQADLTSETLDAVEHLRKHGPTPGSKLCEILGPSKSLTQFKLEFQAINSPYRLQVQPSFSGDVFRLEEIQERT